MGRLMLHYLSTFCKAFLRTKNGDAHRSSDTLVWISNIRPRVESVSHVSSQANLIRQSYQFIFALAVVLWLWLLVPVSLAQSSIIGFPPFNTIVSNGPDSINLANLNVHLTVGVIHQTGVSLPFNYALNFDSTVWEVGGTFKTGRYWDGPIGNNWGFKGIPIVAGGFNHDIPIMGYYSYTGTGGSYSNWVYTDPTGTSHGFGSLGVVAPCPGTEQASGFASDGSGYYMTINSGSGCNADNTPSVVSLFDRSGNNITPVWEFGLGAAAGNIKDPDGNEISTDGNFNFTDTLGDKVLSITGTTQDTTPVTFTYTGPQGAVSLVVNYETYTVQTNFGCSGIKEWPARSYPLVNTIVLPDTSQYSFTYEPTPGISGSITGRIASVTLPTGGLIQYSYTGGSNGISCGDGTAAGLTRTTSDGVTKYSRNSAGTQTTVTDPAGNQTVYTFGTSSVADNNGYEAQHQVYQGSATGTPLQTVVTCYNNNFTGCSSGGLVALPITQTDVYTSFNGSPNNLVETKFDSYGNVAEVKQYDFGAAMPPTGNPVSDTLAYYGQSWNATSCAAYPSSISIVNTPCFSYTKNSAGATVAQTQITYSNTGHPTTTKRLTSGSASLTSTATYNSNGTMATATDANGIGVSTYAYNGTGGCNSLLPTSVTVKGSGLPSAGLTTSAQWNCNGAVLTQTTDANQQATTPTTYTYSDPFWRVASITDPLNNVTNDTYTPTTFETVMNFGTVSTSDTLITTDGLGRQIFSQRRQGQGSSMFDTVQTTYGWSATGPSVTTTVPYPGTLAEPAPSGTGSTTSQGDAMSRPLSISNTGGGVVNNTYSQNDVLSVLGPAPSGENTKQAQTQYDGLGRVTSVCGIESSGGTTCGQVTGSLSGVVTATTYASAAGSQTVTSTRASQSRTVTVDGLGRTTQNVTPEGGTWNYYYDSYSSCPTGYTGLSGQLTAVKDPNGNLLCYAYDALNRVTGVNANGTTCRHFYYDNSTGYAGIPTGVTTPLYPNGRMVEAATDACVTTRTSSTLITDEWFSYDKDGRATTRWESTPHSGTYYESVASYTGPALTAVQLANPTLYTMTYGLEGEGRWSSLTDTTASQNIVTKTTFNAAGQPLNIQLTGTTPDQDIYTYDSNTGNMQTFEFEVGNTPANLTGTLSWNANGSLGELAVIDGFNAGGTEICYSNSSGLLGYGYDDLERLTEFDCGSGNWGQEFSYDQYDNLSKTVISGRTGTTWTPGYSTTTNHCNGCTYDSNGDVTGDGNNLYGWNEFSKVKWTAPSSTPTCGTSGLCATYDAFGRIVETSNGSTWKEYWYTQAGGKMVMSGNTLSAGRWPTSSGVAETLGTTNFEYLHEDWLGNSRIVSNLGNNTVTTDQAFTPYGEIYNLFGTQNGNYKSFGGGDFADLAPDPDTPLMWDTPNRELSYAGRWLSPDPAGSGWNQYAYVTNPNSGSDPTGLGDPPGSNSSSCTLLGGCVSRSNGCTDSRKYTCWLGPLGGQAGSVQGWDEFEIQQLAFTPTGYNKLSAVLATSVDGKIQITEITSYDPIYGNIRLLGLLFPTIVNVTATDPAALNAPSLSSQAAMLRLHNSSSKFPDLCNPGVGLTAKIGPAAVNANLDQSGGNVAPSLEGGPLSMESPDSVSVNMGEVFGVTITGNPQNGTITGVSLFAGLKLGLAELSANIQAKVVNIFSCPN